MFNERLFLLTFNFTRIVYWCSVFTSSCFDAKTKTSSFRMAENNGVNKNYVRWLSRDRTPSGDVQSMI